MRILLVEDDPRIASFVAKGLREQAYAVDVAANGEDALYQASINPYDLAILDVMIPAPDGFEVCRRLRHSGLRFPILMLTARDATEDRVRGLDTGADDYLVKPFEFRELLARLRALLRRSGELRPNRIEIEDLVLDAAAQTAARAGKQIPLTTKEYALLEYLARNAGRVVGREEISEHVIWKLLSADEPAHIDALAEESKLSVPELTGALLGLEMCELVRQLPGKSFCWSNDKG